MALWSPASTYREYATGGWHKPLSRSAMLSLILQGSSCQLLLSNLSDFPGLLLITSVTPTSTQPIILTETVAVAS